MIADRAGRGEPGLPLLLLEVLERAAQVAQPVGLADEVGMQRDAHDERLLGALAQHFVEVVHDHVGEVAAVHLARNDHRDVVQLLRIGDRP